MNQDTAVVVKDPIDAFVDRATTGDLQLAVMMMLWNNRFNNPSFTIQVNPREIKAFIDCVKYLEVKPVIRVLRPGGMPAQEPIAAFGNRRAVPGRAAIPEDCSFRLERVCFTSPLRSE